jgi:hypothetical protein
VTVFVSVATVDVVTVLAFAEILPDNVRGAVVSFFTFRDTSLSDQVKPRT